jgi:Uncharacterized protein conserved in bacteria
MKYFTIDELISSPTAKAEKIDNTPTDKIKKNLTLLVDNILDPLREAYSKPIKVNSGYRCPALNKAVGGVSNSEHLTGNAADISIGGPKENKVLFDLIQKLHLPFRQLLWEHGGAWVHVSYNPNDIKREVKNIG